MSISWQFTLKKRAKNVQVMRIQDINVHEACEFLSTHTHSRCWSNWKYLMLGCYMNFKTSPVCMETHHLHMFKHTEIEEKSTCRLRELKLGAVGDVATSLQRVLLEIAQVSQCLPYNSRLQSIIWLRNSK